MLFIPVKLFLNPQDITHRFIKKHAQKLTSGSQNSKMCEYCNHFSELYNSPKIVSPTFVR